MKLKQIVRDCDMLPPWYYGFSYHNYLSNMATFHIIPLNFVMRFGQRISYLWNYWRGRKPSYVLIELSELREIKMAAYNRGFDYGREWATKDWGAEEAAEQAFFDLMTRARNGEEING